MFYSPIYCPSFRLFHMPYFGRKCPATRGKDCASLLPKTRVSLLPWPARSPDISPIEHVWLWLIDDLFVRVLQHLLLILCGLAYKLRAETFPRKIFRASLIPCHDA